MRGRPLREGDWICGACDNVNFAKRTRCNKCGVLRSKAPQVSSNLEATNPKAAAVGGPPNTGFKKGDWMCLGCQNSNWARRDRCNLCKALKPVVQESDAPRTGRGGGHFDLQDPTDRVEHDSDNEEFDEFGRKKRKRPKIEQNQEQPSTQHASSLLAPDFIKLVFPPAPISESEDEPEPTHRPPKLGNERRRA